MAPRAAAGCAATAAARLVAIGTPVPPCAASLKRPILGQSRGSDGGRLEVRLPATSNGAKRRRDGAASHRRVHCDRRRAARGDGNASAALRRLPPTPDTRSEPGERRRQILLYQPPPRSHIFLLLVGGRGLRDAEVRGVRRCWVANLANVAVVDAATRRARASERCRERCRAMAHGPCERGKKKVAKAPPKRS